MGRRIANSQNLGYFIKILARIWPRKIMVYNGLFKPFVCNHVSLQFCWWMRSYCRYIFFYHTEDYRTDQSQLCFSPGAPRMVPYMQTGKTAPPIAKVEAGGGGCPLVNVISPSAKYSVWTCWSWNIIKQPIRIEAYVYRKWTGLGVSTISFVLFCYH